MPKFVTYWGASYGIPTAEIHPLSWFTPAGGYTDVDIWEISELGIGESLDFTDPTGVHFLMRVE